MLSTCYNDSFLSDFCLGKRPLRIASRRSLLAQSQVYEVFSQLNAWFPKLWIQIHTVTTQGDKDKKTPLHLVKDPQFFTGAVDNLLFRDTCQLAVHSAKDLPIPPTTPLVAITKGLPPQDVLVYAERYLWKTFPTSPKLGSSSSRRNDVLKRLFPQGQLLDIRGTIEERLAQLEEGKYDVIVMAKAAIERLHLKLPYTKELPDSYHPLQGRLAVTAAKNLEKWRMLLRPLNNPTPEIESYLGCRL